MDSASQPPLTIPVVLGSVRPNRRSERPARLLVERLMALGCRSEIVDLRALDLPVYGQDPEAERRPNALALKAAIGHADAVVWLTPEYNHSFTAAIKNAIDYLHDETRRKPMSVCGLSGGGLGGARAVEQLKLVLIELHGVPIRDSVYFSDARTLFDEAGALTRPEFIRRVDDALSELIWYARALAWGRANLPAPTRSRG
ncbi:MAG: NAD(P)H-dependent oxidoreductase [Chloroflexi bacterium]|nr:NAD(P)H-dependent oxidoreductase [Chloroflexota bacterium]